ncbi:hypothetical protein Dsin_008869 [Dipteronia sinensis]|uniref:Reverse transcriptase domain-containing protein n=1 Tax=Dipteronia sinensis TaxID=43782 RepID=A0AAE0EBC7_9ROSI|nr:hypothetical protein Dsin_008869 [Dipteronia sinensis]
MFFIQETKLDTFDFRTFRSLGGSALPGGVGIEAVGAVGGLFSLWNDDEFQAHFCISNNRCVIIVGTLSKIGKVILLCNAYAPNQERERENASWARLDRFLISPEVLLWFPKMIQSGLPRSISDYNMIMLGERREDWVPIRFDFLMDHFKNVSWIRPEIVGLNLSRLKLEENEFLEENFSREEVWSAVYNCDGNKALGSDGFNLYFIKFNWEMIKEDFMKFSNEFHNDGYIVRELNKSFIALIPKYSNQESMRDFRPISLVGSMYKVLAKVLANRLKRVMNLVISDSQIAFVYHRQIIDSFAIAEEIIHSWKKDKAWGLLVKLNFEKAYNSVDHSYLIPLWRAWALVRDE